MDSAMVRRSCVLAVHGGDVELLGLLRRVRMVRALVDAQIAELLAAERPVRQHALHRLLDHALREAAFENVLRGAFLDAADVAGVMVIDLLLALAPGEHHLLGIDDDDVVAVIDMGREGGLVLAAQPHRDDRGEAADDQTLGVDQHPLLLDVGGLGRIRGHGIIRESRAGHTGRRMEARFYTRHAGMRQRASAR